MADTHSPTQPGWIPLDRYDPGVTAEEASKRYLEVMSKRRTVRMYSDRPVSEETIQNIILTASTAPSGAHKQPWRFVAISDPALKKKMRDAAEAEEREFYERRASKEWLDDLAPFGTDASKPFLEIAPWIVVVFKMAKTDPDPETGEQGQVYYLNESVGIATGMLLAAAHNAGLATLTHTPSPMGFLREVLGRPDHERPFLVVPMGYPADDCVVPELSRKRIDEIMVKNLGDELGA